MINRTFRGSKKIWIGHVGIFLFISLAPEKGFGDVPTKTQLALTWPQGKLRIVKVRYIKIIFICLLTCFNAPCLYAEHDDSLRTDLNFHYKINDQFKSVSYVFLQADKNMSNYDYVEWGTALQYQTPLAWLSFLVYYQQGFSKVDPDNWLFEQRPSINMNTSVTLFNFKISNQIRYEYRFTPDWNDYRIKNTLEISRPDIFLQPYIGWELYYENRDKAVMLNRIKFGIIKNIDSNISLGTYYRVDYSNINQKWEFTRQLIGFQITMKY